MPGTIDIIKSLEGRLLGLDGHTDNATLEYAPFLTGDSFLGLRLFPIGKAGNVGSDYRFTHGALYNTQWDDFLGAALNTFNWAQLKGSDGTAVNPALVSGQNGGVCRLTSGSSATGTIAVNGAQITGGRNLTVSNSSERFEARLGKLSAAASQSIFFGLTDTITLNAPFTVAAAVVTANTVTNAVGFVQDSRGTTTGAGLLAVAVNAGGAVQSVNTGLTVDLLAFHNYRIEISATGTAMFFVDGKLVATIAAAVAAAAVLAPTVEMFASGAASSTLDIDHVLAENFSI